MSKNEQQIIEAEVEVVSSQKSNKPKPSKSPTNSSRTDNPFAGFGGVSGMDGSNGMPDLSTMFGKSGMPDLSKIPGLSLRQRLTFKILGLLTNPKLRFLKSKWCCPIWGVITIIVLAIILCAGFFFLIYKLLKAILSPYFSLFSRKGRTN